MSLPKIILDTDKTVPIYELPLKIRQGDTGDELQVTLGKSFEKYTDLSTVDIELIAKTPDERLIKQPVTDKSGNTFKVKFPDEMYTNVGVFRNMYFKIGDDSTSSVKLVVLQGIGSIKEAGSYIDDFETLIKEGQSYVLALKDFADTGNSTIDRKVAELTGKMTDFVDKSKEDLDAAKAAWNKFQSSSQTAFTDAQGKRTSDFNSQKAGFETDFGKQKADFENRFKALLKTLQGDYDSFKALINKDVEDLNTSLDGLDSRATGIENRYDALKVPEIGTRNLVLDSSFESGKSHGLILSKEYDGSPKPFGTYMAKISGEKVTDYSKSWTLDNPIELKAGKTYTFSYYYSTAGSAGGQASDYVFSGETPLTGAFMEHSRHVTSDSTKWERWTSTVKISEDFAITRFRFGFVALNDGYGWKTVDNVQIQEGNIVTDWTPAPEDVQTSITNALDKANYSTTANVDSKVATGVGQAKTYAEQSIKDIIGSAPENMDTIEELADTISKNQTTVDAIDESITKKADKTDVTALQNTVKTMITSISQDDYDALVSAGTVDPKILYVIPDA
ncbi:hypothetical protein [Companilactobacillus versmoldensis]|uniref:Phage-related tail component n=1 Tax=Companilactobacillus versmoldensis DSM 14857 = KCTC 3814 TaxID=1423815 RepID=A0A0R1SSB2_9LACO|nr:hypothetical protein [Companilactobacillus versmoldensis]KRL68091.1 phage-related tail component [Companilactobacillus versmoldensis DSM 14857 = KCTC 3814]